MKPTSTEIIAEACDIAGVPVLDFFGPGRSSGVVAARMAAVHVMHEDLGMSYPEIARAMRRTNHSTPITQHRAYTRGVYASSVVRAVRKRLGSREGAA